MPISAQLNSFAKLGVSARVTCMQSIILCEGLMKRRAKEGPVRLNPDKRAYLDSSDASERVGPRYSWQFCSCFTEYPKANRPGCDKTTRRVGKLSPTGASCPQSFASQSGRWQCSVLLGVSVTSTRRLQGDAPVNCASAEPEPCRSDPFLRSTLGRPAAQACRCCANRVVFQSWRLLLLGTRPLTTSCTEQRNFANVCKAQTLSRL